MIGSDEPGEVMVNSQEPLTWSQIELESPMELMKSSLVFEALNGSLTRAERTVDPVLQCGYSCDNTATIRGS